MSVHRYDIVVVLLYRQSIKAPAGWQHKVLVKLIGSHLFIPQPSLQRTTPPMSLALARHRYCLCTVHTFIHTVRACVLVHFLSDQYYSSIARYLLYCLSSACITHNALCHLACHDMTHGHISEKLCSLSKWLYSGNCILLISHVKMVINWWIVIISVRLMGLK